MGLYRHHFSPLAITGVLANVCVCVVALVLAEISTRATHGNAPYRLDQVLLIAADFAVAISLMTAFVGLYRPKQLGFRTRLGRYFFALSAGSYLTYISIQVIVERGYAAELVSTALLYLIVGILLLHGLLWAARLVVRPVRVLIVGTDDNAGALARDLALSSGREATVVGFYATHNEISAPIGAPGTARVFMPDQPLPQIVAHERIDEIIVAEREQRGGSLPMDQLLTCRIRGTPVLDLAGYFERSASEVRLEGLKASWLIYSEGFVQGRGRRLAKRAFDVAVSTGLLLLTLPVMLLAALAIRIDSPGPIFYRQRRVGFGGQVFNCLKLRSMRVDAENDGVARWASKGDSRVTRVGVILRKMRIDELPQLWSVLRGEMSMVGPRPERPEFVEQLRQKIAFYDVRHSVKPGLTGWAQVRFAYGASVEDAKRKHQFDLYYVKNNSLFLDMMVLVETVSVVLFREGQ